MRLSIRRKNFHPLAEAVAGRAGIFLRALHPF
jgi:hypothetical protein